jgi:hypothetical protein
MCSLQVQYLFIRDLRKNSFFLGDFELIIDDVKPNNLLLNVTLEFYAHNRYIPFKFKNHTIQIAHIKK